MKKFVLIALLLVCVEAVSSQSALPPPFPRVNATQLLETDRIAIWDIVWPNGQPTAMHRHIYDLVGAYYTSGGRSIIAPDGTARPVMTTLGALSTAPKDTVHIEAGTTDPPLRAVFIELKKETASGLPAAAARGPALFPRDGAKKIHDENRVTIWDYTWPSGGEGLGYQPTREAVIVWLGEGTARVTGHDGAATTIPVKAGTMRYMPLGSNQTVEMVSGSPRAMFFELK